MDVHRQGCAWVLLGDGSCGFNNALHLVKVWSWIWVRIDLPPACESSDDEFGVTFCNFQICQGVFCKLGCIVQSLNVSPFFAKKTQVACTNHHTLLKKAVPHM
jgi:hypothetical protein